MLRKMFLIAVIFLLLCSDYLKAGEIIFGWNIKNPSGTVWDMQFMPDNNYFICLTTTDIQIRATVNGELVKSYPFGAFKIEFTPDSNRIVTIANSLPGKLQLRNLTDMSLISEYQLPKDPEGLNIVFQQIRIDPTKPLLYALRTRRGTLSGGKIVQFAKILIYNYETMTQVGELTTTADTNALWSHIAISKDGKYLAAISELYSVLKVWSLETQKEIKYLKLSNDIRALPECLKFSEINTDKIYFSGSFPQAKIDFSHSGLFVYSIKENKIIDSTFAITPNAMIGGEFCYFDNEERIITDDTGYLKILNLLNENIERKHKGNIDSIALADKIIKSMGTNFFIGTAGYVISSCKYDSQIGVIGDNKVIKVLYPNPSNGIVNIPLNCSLDKINYQLFDTNGKLIQFNSIQIINSNLLTIDFSKIEKGTYILKIDCGSTFTTYKLIKQG